MRLLDSHLHLWDPALLDYGWLAGPLARRFGPEEFHNAGGPALDTTSFVFVQAECSPRQALDEAIWVSSLADELPIVAIVARAPLELGRAAADALDQLERIPLVAGVRRLLQDERDGFAVEPEFVAAAREVAARGLVFDACVRSEGIPDVIALADAVPDLKIVLDHLGKPVIGTAGDPVDPRGTVWERDLRSLAQRETVYAKLSGLPAEAPGNWDAEQVWPFLDVALEAFGPQRLLYGSDWPVSETDAPVRWLETVAAWASDRLGASDRAAVLADNAEQLYVAGRKRRPDMPPSTSTDVPVVDAADGLTR